MSQASHNSEEMVVAVVTVCVTPDTVNQVKQAIGRMPWVPIYANMDSYMTGNRASQFSQKIIGAHACIALVDFDANEEESIDTTNYLNQMFYGRIAIVAISSNTDQSMLLRAMRGGCNEYLLKPFDRSQFSDALIRLEERWAHTAALPHSGGQVLSFLGAKGGVGTTSLAVHLAMALVTRHQKKVLLIDGHPQFGHVGLYLGLEKSRYDFHELLKNVNRLDRELLGGFVVRHSSGLEVLASPDTHIGSRTDDPDAIERTLEFLRGEYDYVLVDCTASLEDSNLVVIDHSDHVYLVATPEVGAIRDLSHYIDGLVKTGRTTDNLHFVMNRTAAKEALSTEQIEKAIRLPLSIKIPNSFREVITAINSGEPVASDKKSDFSAQIQRWANSVVTSSNPEAPVIEEKRFAFWR